MSEESPNEKRIDSSKENAQGISLEQYKALHVGLPLLWHGERCILRGGVYLKKLDKEPYVTLVDKAGDPHELIKECIYLVSKTGKIAKADEAPLDENHVLIVVRKEASLYMLDLQEESMRYRQLDINSERQSKKIGG